MLRIWLNAGGGRECQFSWTTGLQLLNKNRSAANIMLEWMCQDSHLGNKDNDAIIIRSSRLAGFKYADSTEVNLLEYVCF